MLYTFAPRKESQGHSVNLCVLCGYASRTTAPAEDRRLTINSWRKRSSGSFSSSSVWSQISSCRSGGASSQPSRSGLSVGGSLTAANGFDGLSRHPDRPKEKEQKGCPRPRFHDASRLPPHRPDRKSTR